MLQAEVTDCELSFAHKMSVQTLLILLQQNDVLTSPSLPQEDKTERAVTGHTGQTSLLTS